MLIWSLAFNHWLNCVAWSCSVACSNEHVANLCMFLPLEFQCLLFWMLLLHDAESDSEVFLVCILCSTVHLSCHADVKLMLRMQFLISLLLSILFIIIIIIIINFKKFTLVIKNSHFFKLAYSLNFLNFSRICFTWFT